MFFAILIRLFWKVNYDKNYALFEESGKVSMPFYFTPRIARIIILFILFSWLLLILCGILGFIQLFREAIHEKKSVNYVYKTVSKDLNIAIQSWDLYKMF